MTHSKNKNGFTLIEVLLATAIVGAIIGPLYFLQGTVFDRVLRMVGAVERMFIAYDFFLDAQKEGDQTVTEKVDDPQTNLIYEQKNVSGVLKNDFIGLSIQQVRWDWRDPLGRSTEYDTLVKIVFEPPEEPKEKEEEEKPPATPPAGKPTPPVGDKT